MMTLASWQQEPGWEAHHAPAAPWWSWLLVLGVLAVLAFLVLRAWQARRRYRLADLLPSSAQDAVRAALVAAEKRTVGEVVPVVLGRSDRYPAALLWCALLYALAAYWLEWALPGDLGRTALLFLLLGAAGLGWLCAWLLPELRRAFVPPWRLREMAEEQAFQEFYRAGLHRTTAGTGVLLFVSLFERQVVVMGEEGINAKVQPATWEEIDDLVLKAAAEERLADGLVAAVQRIGEILAAEFPWREGDRNEVPDRLILRAE